MPFRRGPGASGRRYRSESTGFARLALRVTTPCSISSRAPSTRNSASALRMCGIACANGRWRAARLRRRTRAA